MQAEDAYPRSNPLAGNQAAIENGARLYFKWCVACHGNAADGEGTRFGGSWGYGANLTKFWRGYCDFVVIVLNGRTDKMMPPWGGVLEEEESEIVLFYFFRSVFISLFHHMIYIIYSFVL